MKKQARFAQIKSAQIRACANLFALASLKILCNTVYKYRCLHEQRPKKVLGARLRAARVAAKLSQDFVAETMGVTRQSVSAWETGCACPSALQLGQLAAAYCVCAHTLLFGEAFMPLRLRQMLSGRANAIQKSELMTSGSRDGSERAVDQDRGTQARPAEGQVRDRCLRCCAGAVCRQIDPEELDAVIALGALVHYRSTRMVPVLTWEQVGKPPGQGWPKSETNSLRAIGGAKKEAPTCGANPRARGGENWRRLHCGSLAAAGATIDRGHGAGLQSYVVHRRRACRAGRAWQVTSSCLRRRRCSSLRLCSPGLQLLQARSGFSNALGGLVARVKGGNCTR